MANSYWGYQQAPPFPRSTDFLAPLVKFSLKLEHVHYISCTLKSIFREIYFLQFQPGKQVFEKDLKICLQKYKGRNDT